MKQPKNQNQHIIPQVYLKQFGYISNDQYKVSVLKTGEKFTRQKSIKSFLAQTNIFDIESDNPEIERLFESLNCDIENVYSEILSDLETENKLSNKSKAILLQLIPNFIARSNEWRSNLIYLLNSDAKENILKMICAHRAENLEELVQRDFYRVMVDNPVDEIINRALLFFQEYLLRRIGHYEIVILKSQEGKPWFTTDNPIVLENRTRKFEFMSKESEVYFPLNPEYLIYLHFRDSDDKTNELRNLESNVIHIATDEQNFDLQQKVMRNAHEYVIIDGEFKYRIGKEVIED
ncbi:DUF4238 domain-containing protein [Flavobacterium reichenbachii]|uniref:DUF4238 domain-containing protein n=1 Tax=Flavobacterium reichenbachii TaxID=362418 RepID=A0A085ZN18_9FLAO|nr:DUF4238 domain-containing protein [Flavobacterium reichenbachii]KFF05832.1 hypothetical protein IW19_09990 [Flavobacterium reichenbachii]OXB12717.1 hypothetical protein B0A68_18185 [Flavobacterium reichenbachii]